MALLTSILIAAISLEHLFFLLLETYFWDKPLGRKVFGHSLERAQYTKVLAFNQGVYNGFLAIGLWWGLILGDHGYSQKVFFLSCVALAGIVGGKTASKTIFYVQGIPAIIALLLLMQ